MSTMLAIRVFAPFALGYCVVSVFRSINAVIAPDLVRDLALGPSGLGFAVSAFFLAGTLFQIPCGVLLDRYDPRHLFAAFLLVSAVGTVVTAVAQDILELALGRALMAIGTTTALVTTFKVFSMWLPPERLPLANGLSLAAGGIGVMAGTVPVEIALAYLDWRAIHLVLGAALLVCAAVVLLLAPARATTSRGLRLVDQIAALAVVLRSVAFWRAAPLSMIVVGVLGAAGMLWAGPWVRDVAGMSERQAANVLLVVAGAMTVGGLLTGWLTDLARRAGLHPMEFVIVSAGACALTLALLFLQWMPSPLVVFLIWGAFSFTTILNFVTYAALTPLFAPELIGRLNACLTLSWMLGAFLLQNLYGLVLDLFPSSGDHYAVEGHRWAMGLMLVLLIAALAWFYACPHVLRGWSAARVGRYSD